MESYSEMMWVLACVDEKMSKILAMYIKMRHDQYCLKIIESRDWKW